ncbi:hypothetical protein ACP26L_02255 [Paenibacillus sp. S-38]|uniref:hypothetical protein n=1 Tax=Paenibacillus sp. S-38 TaxID=3416710 RepID=UPI003CF667C0
MVRFGTFVIKMMLLLFALLVVTDLMRYFLLHSEVEAESSKGLKYMLSAMGTGEGSNVMGTIEEVKGQTRDAFDRYIATQYPDSAYVKESGEDGTYYFYNITPRPDRLQNTKLRMLSGRITVQLKWPAEVEKSEGSADLIPTYEVGLGYRRFLMSSLNLHPGADTVWEESSMMRFPVSHVELAEFQIGASSGTVSVPAPLPTP